MVFTFSYNLWSTSPCDHVTFTDEVLSDDEQIKKWDFSDNLVGKVKNEIQIPVSNKKDREFLFNVMKQGCVDYLRYNVKKNRARVHTDKIGYTSINSGDGAEPRIENIQLTQSWVVSQYAGDYNPIHFHTGCLLYTSDAADE